MKANRTHQAPPIIENLGDGTFYYNFNVIESQLKEEGIESSQQASSYNYDQVRCDLPVEKQKVQECINQEGYNHQVSLN